MDFMEAARTWGLRLALFFGVFPALYSVTSGFRKQVRCICLARAPETVNPEALDVQVPTCTVQGFGWVPSSIQGRLFVYTV